jgi:hypothetical protein
VSRDPSSDKIQAVLSSPAVRGSSSITSQSSQSPVSHSRWPQPSLPWRRRLRRRRRLSLGACSSSVPALSAATFQSASSRKAGRFRLALPPTPSPPLYRSAPFRRDGGRRQMQIELAPSRAPPRLIPDWIVCFRRQVSGTCTSAAKKRELEALGMCASVFNATDSKCVLLVMLVLFFTFIPCLL